MKDDELVEILDAHSASLIVGPESDQQQLQQYPEHSVELASLFSIASSLKKIMVPQEAESYKEALRRQLLSEPATGPLKIALASKRRLTWGVVAAAGSLISVVGLAIIVIRRVKTGTSQETQTAAGTA